MKISIFNKEKDFMPENEFVQFCEYLKSHNHKNENITVESNMMEYHDPEKPYFIKYGIAWCMKQNCCHSDCSCGSIHECLIANHVYITKSGKCSGYIPNDKVRELNPEFDMVISSKHGKC